MAASLKFEKSRYVDHVGMKFGTVMHSDVLHPMGH